jgi:WD40-like Beta Propeller Repeat
MLTPLLNFWLTSRKLNLNTRGYLMLGLAAGAVAGGGCAGVKSNATAGSAGSTGSGRGGVIGTGGSGATPIPPCVGPCTDFPRDPYFDTGVSHDVTGMFGSPSYTGGPCITEPEDGALFPNNWLRPRVRVPGSTGVLKITIHADREANDLVAYTHGESWAMPKDVWTGLAYHVVDEDITVTVQTPAGGATSVKFQVAPVGAGGSMVFWAANPAAAGKTGVENMTQDMLVDDSMLMGFTVGDESAVPTLKITDVKQQVALQNGLTQKSHCIGCHSGTPDGDYVAFVDAWPWGAAFAGIKPGTIGDALPGFVGGECTDWNNCKSPKTFAQYPWNGPMTFSPAHWSAYGEAGDRIAIIATQIQDITMPWGQGSPNWQAGRLAWVDLKSTATTTTNGQTNPTRGTAFDYLPVLGDPHPAAAFPTWSHDGDSIVYVSVACPNPGQQNGCGTQDGRLYKGAADLYEVPFGNRAGGTAMPVPGASTADAEEYYPAFSPDDRLIAYTRVPAGLEMFANPSAEMYVVPHQGGQAQKLAANNPPACSGKMSPGVNNHWPRWSPDRASVGTRTFYWLIFSSNRYGLPPVTTSSNGQTKTVQVSQLYITAVVVDGSEILTKYPAIYLWNQPQSRLNTTPAWDNFHIFVD